MKIGISCYPTYGGSGIVATELGKHLAKRGHNIHFISYALPYRLNGYYNNITFHEVTVPEYPLFEYPPYALALATQMANVVVNEKLDLLHVHYAIPHAISAILAREMIKDQREVKIVTTLHGTDITLVGADPSYKRTTQYGINQSDAVTAVSEYLKKSTIKKFSPQIPIKVIYNFIDGIPEQNDDCRCLRERFSPNNEPVLVHLSNFRPVKRVLDTIQILKRVLENRPAKLVLIGDGPDRASAERLVRKFGIQDHVFFLGKQEDVYCLLSVGDIFLMPSENESFGLAALEAMSCGLPCVTSAAGGLTELNRDGETGFSAPVGDVEKMASQVLTILDTPNMLKNMSENVKKYAVDFFLADKIIPQYISLYESVLKK